ncbi:MAG: response regulator, partial [Ignavibacteriaceae bacterium]|nr:response regulator [Ignavibacteriaceae bacterium]
IQGYAELLAESLTDSESLQMVNSIIESSKRLTDTLDKILSLSKLEFEGIQVQKADVNINDLLRECYSLFISLSNQKGIKFNLKLLDTPISIVTDEKLLRGIICNLVNNAIKFTPKGKVELAASIYSSNDSNYLRILVSDTGIGIPKEKQDQIWMAFRQASEGLSRTFEGTGLGLTITRKYVELLGGNILLESEYGKGSSFIVELEVGKNYDQNLENKQIDFPKSEERLNQDIKDGKILYVEDDEYSRDVVVRTLSKLHFVETAASAEKALEMMEREKYDVILIDINLKHGMDGVQLMEKVKKIPYYRGVPLVAVTAYASETDRDEFLSKGFSNYISKPFVLSKLQKYVKEIYDNSRETD